METILKRWMLAAGRQIKRLLGPSVKPTFPFRIDFPPELPISARASEIIEVLRQNQVVILAGETGSGKTTQIPKMCLAAGGGHKGRIACTQPRRVAALSVSRRVAEELGVNWGREVGCKVRFDDHTSNATVVKFLTDGMLLAEVQSDPQLRDYDTIIVDEAHERSLNIDFLLGHLRQLRHQRPELQIVITSATIDTASFSKAFDDAPVIEVSGRTFPVEVIYEPLDGLGSDAEESDEPAAKAEALHYIEGAVAAVERILTASASGDILVFMPAERDIRETHELLEGRRLRGCEIVTLFGRLSNAEQQRVFAPSQRRKIILATNIAETSLTIPGIHYVVDTGLARVSRYAAQARTRRLPIEEIAQSSADQRKGRCGRVADGVCIRLYSEQDYNARPRFMQPEIQRANLADVILRMKAFGLGDIERFPFINMPASKAIRAGYALLEELGAIEATSLPEPKTANASESDEVSRYTHTLTPLGRELARLPVDPTVGRMILQARDEKCLREVLVIASGLSIQDPRERPMEAREKADAAHRRFSHPDSDFLALLKIWEAFHDQLETLSQSKLRRFCRDHFLSYTRLREWRDIHAQLVDVLGEREEFRNSSVFDGMSEKKREEPINHLLAWTTPAYRSIHRAILAGLLSNIAIRDEENGGYKATHDRRVNLFPGSALFSRPESGGRENARRGESKGDGKPARWIMAAEIMETSRLYARTCARLDPTWALDLGKHLVRESFSDPFWQVDGGRVLVKRRTRLYGLELESRAVGYGRVDPRAATEIFIREGLVNDTITWPYSFLAHNRAVRERIENLLTRARHSGYMNLDEAIFRFYAKRLIDDQGDEEAFEPISAVAELTPFVRLHETTEPNFLRMEEDDLRDPEELLHDTTAFPETLPMENRALPLNYAYKPGQADDGVTLEVNVRDAAALTPAALDWAVPGHLEPKVEHYLRATPKELRKAFVPLTETARQLTMDLRAQAASRPPQRTLVEALATAVEARHRIHIDPTYWTSKPLPDHLRVRVRLVDDQGKEVAAGRDLGTVQEGLQAHTRELSQTASREDPAAWQRARARWEKSEQSAWTFGDVPAQVIIAEQDGVPIRAYPALRAGDHGVSLRLYKTPEAARAASRRGWSQLMDLELRHELTFLQKDVKRLRSVGPLASTLVSGDELQQDAYEAIRRWLIDPTRSVDLEAQKAARATVSANAGLQAIAPISTEQESGMELKAAHFEDALKQAKRDLRASVSKLTDELRQIFELRQAMLVHATPYPELASDLAALLPKHFLLTTPYARLDALPRYLKAMKLRADRWRQNPAKDRERAGQLAQYQRRLEALLKMRSTGDGQDELTETIAGLRWSIEELRVSFFAQELGTSESISAVKLDRAFAEVDQQIAQERAVATESAAGPRGPGKAAPAGPNAGLKTKPAAAKSDLAQRPVSAIENKGAPLKSLNALDSLFRR